MENTREKILASREHPIITARKQELAKNLLCLEGGLPYINERLTRFPCEIQAEYDARKSKAYLSNYAGRLTSKINQHLFSKEPERVGVDELFYLDVSKSSDQTTLQELMTSASSLLTTCGWCWVRVDRDNALLDDQGQPIDQSLADKEARGDRPFLTLYNPLQVIDWCFGDDTGKLEWLITEEIEWSKADPFKEHSKMLTRTVWTPYNASTYAISIEQHTGERDAKLIRSVDFELGEVPFCLLGKPSSKPVVFDDIERTQAQMLNIESSHSYSIWRSHFAMLVMPDSMIKSLSQAYEIDEGTAASIVLSEGRALTEEPEDKNLTRWIAPPATDISIRREEVNAMKTAMFEAIGLYMRQSGKSVESAESKGFDYKDIEGFLSQRAVEMENFERRVVKMCEKVDPLFPTYTPMYEKDFSQADPMLMQNIVLALQMGQPEEVEKQYKKIALSLIEDSSGIEMSSSDKQDLFDAIDNQEQATLDNLSDIS